MSPGDHRHGVVVVGAGFSGLAAARALHRAGVDVMVVEGRDRVGGRAWTTISTTGIPVDRGGQWIGPGQDHLRALAEEFGVATVPTFTAGETVEWRDGRRRTYSGLVPTSDPAAAAEAVEVMFDLDLASQQVPVERPWEAPGASDLDAGSLGSWLATHCTSPGARAMVDAAVKAIWGAEADELSLLFTLFYIRAGGGLSTLIRTAGGAQDRHFVGGVGQLAAGMADELGQRVLLGHPVRAIEWSGECAVVSGPGWQLRADRVVVAVSPALAGQIAWIPALPLDRVQLGLRMPMGAVTKVHALYDDPFWREEGLNGQLVSHDGFLRSTFDDSPENGPGVLVGFVAGSDARVLGSVADRRRREVLLDELSRAFGPPARMPRQLLEQHWAEEPFSLGGPVALGLPGALSRYGPALRAPVGRLHWAGTETATRWCGYLDGALSAGHRAALEAARALGVRMDETDPAEVP